METTARVGRNEPCPCGSGKKYKACCATRVSVVAEARRSPGLFIAVAVIGLGLAGAVAFHFLGQRQPPPASTGTVIPTAPVTPPPVATNQSPAGGPVPQPPGPVPEGKVWSPEHGHWHDAPSANAPNAPLPLAMGAMGPPSPSPAPAAQPFAPGTPAPPGPAPAGKVWSTEHGHWHDLPAAGVVPQ